MSTKKPEFIFVPETNPSRPGTTRVPPSLYRRQVLDYPTIKLPFPPTITPEELSTSPNKNKVVKSKAPNCFFVYRLAYVRELKNMGRQFAMTEISGIIASSWNKEPKHVKQAYRKLSQDANKMHKKRFGDVQAQPHTNSNDFGSGFDLPYYQQNNPSFIEPLITTYVIDDYLQYPDIYMEYLSFIGQHSKDESSPQCDNSDTTELPESVLQI
ncbi:17954_t:CDS:2 [Funneliformis geosporum]|uniref:3897_t:CDS:1 n=1 Tax=Funneliformis geosporum TaxID=1117311 RepID=A0A9W4SH69_9GLOM|nr:17954_t:CDS:2 [Funneliformis geosporum]CAI2168404.1 3897_t:CDS:2 [Funneliformis geosporum]